MPVTAAEGAPAGAAPGTSVALPRLATRGAMTLVLASSIAAAMIASFGTIAILGTGRPAAVPVGAGAGPAGSPAGLTTGAITVNAQDVAAAVAAQARGSVVTISSGGRGAFAARNASGGSGFVVSSEGLVLTAAHVLGGATDVTVTLADGRQLSGHVVASDGAQDLAVIRLADSGGVVPLDLGSSRALTIGQVAIAIGSPLGTFTQSVTEGIVSGLGREASIARSGFRGNGARLSGLIQTDASVSSGYDGGPLLDSTGRVIGIVVTSATGAQGIGFAVPVDSAAAVIGQARNS